MIQAQTAPPAVAGVERPPTPATALPPLTFPPSLEYLRAEFKLTHSDKDQWGWVRYIQHAVIRIATGEWPADMPDREERDAATQAWVAMHSHYSRSSETGGDRRALEAEWEYGRFVAVSPHPAVVAVRRNREVRAQALAGRKAAADAGRRRAEEASVWIANTDPASVRAWTLAARQMRLATIDNDDPSVAAHSLFKRCHAKLSALASRAGMSQEEAGAVLCHLAPNTGYQKNTLLALQSINRYASINGIRPEDAVIVFREYL
jgi:hypothetical protein